MSDVNLSISQEVVKPIIEAKIHAAIVEQLKGAESMMESIVTRVLMTKVDDEGKSSCYAREKSFVQWLCEQCIRDAALAAVKEASVAMKPKIQAQIVKELQKRQNEIAGQLVTFFAESAGSSFFVKTNVEFKKIER